MVKAWKEKVVIPTYECGKMEKNPIFLEKRVYQGSSGVVYPYPVIEKISDERIEKTYQAVWLENEYIKVMILPELGGRVQMAYDKIKQRHFVYYNHVIKPALVGLAGPWISGGIEFNWPQHHRPSTYIPVDCDIEEHTDGSITVWVNEMERMFHQKGMAGFTLRPGCAYLEIKARLYNRTDLPQTFLWWANPAVEVNDHYQSVFPQDVNAVFDHGKRDVSSFPIATGTYYKMDYSAGVDISNYKNIKVPTSYMAVNSKYDFEGGYENDTHGGMLHVANHHVSPGKKQWTWGNGDFGRAWDRCLTDNDYEDAPGLFRPYIELMAGVYTENQPDFTWLMPGEEKEFIQYFMPYRELGIVKQASKDIIFNIDEEKPGSVRLRLMTTSRKDITINICRDNGEEIYNEKLTLTPEIIYNKVIGIFDARIDEITIKVNRLEWHAESDEVKKIPDAAEAALLPEDTKSVEQLYLTGLHLEQYRHATWSALDYYEEGLRRDPMDVRINNQMGLWYLRRGRFDKAEPYFRTSVKVLQKRNPNPYWGEPLYNLGLTLKYLGKLNEAYDWFYKATWNGGWQNHAYFTCAQISTLQGRYEDALYETERAIRAGGHHHKARALRVALLRLLGREEEALELCIDSLNIDRFNYGCLFEQYLLSQNEELLSKMDLLMHGNAENYHELALDYIQAGLWSMAKEVLCHAMNVCNEKYGKESYHPMTLYYLGYVYAQEGKNESAIDCFQEAERANSFCCFPNRLEDILTLQCAISMNFQSAKANYYLGCLYYDKRQYDLAIDVWQTSAKQDETFPTVWRNLALAAFNKKHDTERAVTYMERAFSLDTTDSRILMELDQLYKRLQRPHNERLTFLQKYPTLIEERDDLVLEEITLLNLTGRYEEAMARLDKHIFHPWEGGEGKVPAQYQFARVELAKREIQTMKMTTNPIEESRAIKLLEECLTYPLHLGEGKLINAQENDFYYLMGIAYENQGKIEKAKDCWLKATYGPTEPAAAMYYNDAKPDKIFYAGLAYKKLYAIADTNEERSELQRRANGIFYRLISYGEKHLFDSIKMDYFAVSLPDLLIWEGDLQEANTIHCKLMMSLGYYGIGNQEKAMRYLDEVEYLNRSHLALPALQSLWKMEELTTNYTVMNHEK